MFLAVSSLQYVRIPHNAIAQNMKINENQGSKRSLLILWV